MGETVQLKQRRPVLDTKLEMGDHSKRVCDWTKGVEALPQSIDEQVWRASRQPLSPLTVRWLPTE